MIGVYSHSCKMSHKAIACELCIKRGTDKCPLVNKIKITGNVNFPEYLDGVVEEEDIPVESESSLGIISESDVPEETLKSLGIIEEDEKDEL